MSSEALSLIRRHEGCTRCILKEPYCRQSSPDSFGRSRTKVVRGTSIDEIPKHRKLKEEKTKQNICSVNGGGNTRCSTWNETKPYQRLFQTLQHVNYQQLLIRFTTKTENYSKNTFNPRFVRAPCKRPSYNKRLHNTNTHLFPFSGYNSHHPRTVKGGTMKCHSTGASVS